MSLFHLSSRGVVKLTGADRHIFLQRLITNDIHLLASQSSLYTLLLNPQGRILHDFFVIEHEENLFIEIRREMLTLLLQRLHLYKLGAKISFEDVSDDYLVVTGAEKDLKDFSCFYYRDLRHSDLPSRGFMKLSQLTENQTRLEEEYVDLCLGLGIPEEGRGLESGRTIPLEAGIQDLNGISWTKGCYIGQELIARTYHRGEIRKRFFPLSLSAPLTALSAPITTAAGDSAGEIVFARHQQGIARLRLEFLEQPLFIGPVSLKVSRPEWIKH